MSENEVPKPETNLPAMVGSRSPMRCIVTLPPTDIILCLHLLHQIADAVEPRHAQGRSGHAARRAAWSETVTGGSPYSTDTGGSGAPRSESTLASLDESAPHLESWLNEVQRRWHDLQKWVDRGEISIFGSDRVKYRQISNDTYMKRQDAVRYCQQSGFEEAVDRTISGTASAASVQETTASSISADPRKAMTSPVPPDTARKQEPSPTSSRKYVGGKPKPSGNTRITAYIDDFVDKTRGTAEEVRKRLMSELKNEETRPEFVLGVEELSRKQGNRDRRELVVYWENEYGVKSKTGQKTIANRVKMRVEAREGANNRSPSGDVPSAFLPSPRALAT